MTAASLTRNQTVVLEALRSAGRALSAYQILDLTAAEGVKAPPQVYRALERLVEVGLVHRIESLNAYLSCDHPAHEDDVAFAICERCGSVTEIALDAVRPALAEASAKEGFALHEAHVELKGICHRCV